jgi:hypothetical protein
MGEEVRVEGLGSWSRVEGSTFGTEIGSARGAEGVAEREDLGMLYGEGVE